MEKKKYQASSKYHVEYNRRKYKRIEIVFDKEKDIDVLTFLESKNNRAFYIKKIILQAMKNEREK